MKVKVLNDSTVRVQVKAEHVEGIRKKADKWNRDPQVTENGSWIVKGSGGWVTISAFGSDGPDKIVADLLALENIISSK